MIEDIDYLFTDADAQSVFLGRLAPTSGNEWAEARYLTFGTDLSGKSRAVIWTPARSVFARFHAAPCDEAKGRSMKASSKSTAVKRKKKSEMDIIDAELEIADFSKVSTKHAVKMAAIHDARSRRGRPSVETRGSIILPDELIERIKRVAELLNIGGYQPLIRIILSEKLAEYEKRAHKNRNQ